MVVPLLEIRLLGSFQVLVQGCLLVIAAQKQRRLLAELALRQGRAVSRDELVTELWPESDDARGRDSLRHALWQLRRTLGASGSALQASGDHLALNSDATVDVTVFERHLTRGDPAALHAAVALYRGDLCAEFDGTAGEIERERLRRRYLDAAITLARYELTTDDPRAAIGVMRAAVRHDPYHEESQQLLLEALAAAGETTEVVRHYQRLRSTFRDELGVEPSAQTQALFARLARRDSRAGDAGAEVRRPSASPPPTLVGRLHEYSGLIERLAAAVDANGGVVQLAGEAGAGKTRLLDELARTARDHGFHVIEGRAVSAEGRLGYQLWIDALRPVSDAAARLPAPWPAVLGALLPELAGTPSPGESPWSQLQRTRLCEGVARLLGSLAETLPVVVILDDLHWADADALHLLHYLAHALRTTRITFVFAARPAGRDTNAPLLDLTAHLRAARLLSEIELGPLDVGEVEQLLIQAGLTHASSTALGGSVARLTGGNPLYVLETVRALVEQGVLRRDHQERFSVSGGLTAELELPPLQLPEDVRATILSRVDVLPEATRSLLNPAAILGQAFTPELLGTVSGRDELRVIDDLEPAIAAELLRDAEVGRQRGLAFSHDLVREAIYQQQPLVRRAALHRRIAAVLEARGAPSATLAHHLGAAGEHERAAPHWIAAGRAADAGFAHEEAIRAYRAALGGVPAADVEQRVELLEQLGQAHLRLGVATDAVRCYEEALELLPGEQFPLERAHVQSLLALACGRNYLRHPDARAHAAAAVVAYGGHPPGVGQCEALLGLAFMQYQGGDVAAIGTARHALALAQRLDLPRQASAAFHVLTWAQLFAGEPDRDEEIEAAEELVARLGQDEEAANLANIIGLRRLGHGDLLGARRAYALSAEVAREVGSLRTELLALEWLARVCGRLGDLEAALEHGRQALAINQRLSLSVDAVNLAALSTIAAVHAFRREDDPALDICRTLIDAPFSVDEQGRPFHSTGQIMAYRIMLLLGRPDLIPSSAETRVPRPRCHDCDLGWLFIVGQQAARGTDPARGLEWAQELEAQMWRAGTGRLVSEVGYIRALGFSALGRLDEARAELAQAVAHCERIGHVELLTTLRRDPDLPH